MKYINLLFIEILALVLFSCSDDNSNVNRIEDSPLKIAIYTDCHYFASELGSGSEFDYYCKTENKLVAESQALNASLVDNIIAENCNIVLIPGDLTLNGEKANHLKMQELLTNIENSGKKVFVIPGNHDINNPFSYKYIQSERTKIDNINKDEFVNIYNNFGYSDAYSRDVNSLSYSADLDSSTILLALDGTKYEQYTATGTISSGEIKDQTIAWMNQILHNAKSSNKRIIAMMHHSLIEHFAGQSSNPISGDYVLDNGAIISKILADSGVSVIFTGHFHANDISQFVSESGNTIFDIETGSVLTYPHSYRIAELTKSKIKITTKNISNVKYNDIVDFDSYSVIKTKSLLVNYFNSYWNAFTANFPGNYSQETKTLVKESFVSAVFAHYIGDESINEETSQSIKILSESESTGLNIIAYLMSAIYTDLTPKDRNVELIINK